LAAAVSHRPASVVKPSAAHARPLVRGLFEADLTFSRVTVGHGETKGSDQVDDSGRARTGADSRAHGRRDARGHRGERGRRKPRFGRFLWFTALGTFIPGTGLLAAGRRGWGGFFLTLVVLGVLGLGYVAWRTPRNQLAMTAFDRDQLTIIAIGIALIALIWLIVALASHRALEPDGLSGGKRFGGAVVLIVAASLVLSPMALAARYAWTQHDLLGALSRDSSTAPELDKHNPWEDKPRVNVLLLGSDGDDGRTGVRPDTMIMTSIDTDTGDAVMLSLPRNLERVPFPSGSPLRERFPYGFQGQPGEDKREYMLNAVYNNVPNLVGPEFFAGSEDPGADATKLAVSGALGLDVDYYVMADLQGFRDIVDAMGGIVIDVNYPVPMATKVDEGGRGCVWNDWNRQRWILPGADQQLTGYQALWFARARCAPDHPEYAALYQEIGGNPVRDDYNRMERQRCVMGAIAQRAEPMRLLTNFESLASATERNITTDIPADLWPAFAELGLKVKDATMTSLPLTRDVIEPSNPDYIALHALVQEALDPAAAVEEVSTEAGSTPDPEGETGESPAEDTSGEPTSDGLGDDEPETEDEPAPVDVAAVC
jgi:anionic cell wall polymer biosynthesis LytR-Cps2A-Psr (LCP) family protein